MEENKINTEEEVIIEQMPEHSALDNPALTHKKNLIRLLVLSVLGLLSVILLAISLFLIGIKIF
ncbi:MAG: hypothetical protein K1X86_07145 [Ignavibacteria bacterium]|nr:hypothetical protein [Ignavibacteria bacterium]